MFELVLLVKYRTEDIHDLYFAVSKITTHYYNDDYSVNPEPRKFATGFFFKGTNNKFFLVTNKHVVKNEVSHYYPNVIRIYLHTAESDLTQNKHFDIPLYSGSKRRWAEATENYDVVAIPLDEDFAMDACVNYFSVDFLFPKKYKMSPNQELMILGYPKGMWYDQIHNLPIIRRGTISSAYPIPYNQYNYFVVEARLHEGTSGAPVITKPTNKLYEITKKDPKTKTGWGPTEEEKELDVFRHRFILVGINASTFPFPQNKDEGSLDLNAVYFSEVLRTLTA